MTPAMKVGKPLDLGGGGNLTHVFLKHIDRKQHFHSAICGGSLGYGLLMVFPQNTSQDVSNGSIVFFEYLLQSKSVFFATV